ncbi:hypothetical protein [Halobacillus litoralis]|uniref:hypothetical protein n=1 Tax=Halobacillus litoralis TaxID=45668 RepID=UPI0013E8F395|nr:hypothetical protein [Halobacillus litoralis]
MVAYFFGLIGIEVPIKAMTVQAMNICVNPVKSMPLTVVKMKSSNNETMENIEV